MPLAPSACLAAARRPGRGAGSAGTGVRGPASNEADGPQIGANTDNVPLVVKGGRAGAQGGRACASKRRRVGRRRLRCGRRSVTTFGRVIPNLATQSFR